MSLGCFCVINKALWAFHSLKYTLSCGDIGMDVTVRISNIALDILVGATHEQGPKLDMAMCHVHTCTFTHTYQYFILLCHDLRGWRVSFALLLDIILSLVRED